VLVNAVVVDDQMHVELAWYFLVDPPKETQELLVPVPGFALGDFRSGSHVRGCKQYGDSWRMESWVTPST
jgi:hypothetical protein